MSARTYKKYMKQDYKKDYGLWKLFIISFFGMLFVFTYLINSFTPSVDVSIGDYKQETDSVNYEEVKKNVDERLAMIQNEDQGKTFTQIMQNAEDVVKEEVKLQSLTSSVTTQNEEDQNVVKNDLDPFYKVFIGSYTSIEQAKVAKEIILESNSNLNPIIKCIGSNDYTLQVGTFKNKKSAEALLYTVKQNNLPGRIVQDY